MGDLKEEIQITVVAGTITFVLLAIFIIVFVLMYKKRQQKNKMEKMQMQTQFEQELLRSQLEIQEQTFRNISQEIHDNIGQMLSLAKLNLAMKETEPGFQSDQKITNSHQLISKAIQDLRDLSRSLSPEYISQIGLQKSIDYELDMISRTGVLSTQLKSEGAIRKIDKHKELILFRIVQESLNNIIKHARAKNITVTLNYFPEKLTLQIADDGKGIDAALQNPDSEEKSGLGLKNMHNRARLIGADFDLRSELNKGTEINIVLPLQ